MSPRFAALGTCLIVSFFALVRRQHVADDAQSRASDGGGLAFAASAATPDAAREREKPRASRWPVRKRHWWHVSVGGVRDPAWYYEEYCMALPDARAFLDRSRARGIEKVPAEFRAGQLKAMARAERMVSEPWSPACEWLHADPVVEVRVSAR